MNYTNPFERFQVATTTEINRTFKIKVTGLFHGKQYHNFVGVSGLTKIIQLFKFNQIFEQALKNKIKKQIFEITPDFKIVLIRK